MPAKKKKRGRPREKRRYRRKVDLKPTTAEATIVAVETDTLETPKESLEVTSVDTISVTDSGNKDVPLVVETKDTFIAYREKVSQIGNLFAQLQKIQLLILAALVLGGLLLGLLAVNLLVGDKSSESVQTKQNQAPTQAVTNTSVQSAPAVDLSKYSIEVLNGSKITGEATKLKSSLQSNGFKVATAGDAPTANQQETIVQIKQGVDPAYINMLDSFLARFYTLGGQQVLPTNEKTDVVVIIGNKTP